MPPFTAKTYNATTGQSLSLEHDNLPDAVTPDIDALAKTGQTILPQRSPNDATMSNIAVLAKNAGCVGRVCSRGSISQARSARVTSDSGQSPLQIVITYIKI